ncbi:hypothetical protein AOLI_G00162370 [Acnodon oligacanthus]
MLTLHEFDWPFVLAQQLRDSCRRWLLSEECDSEEVLNLVVLEQFITPLPKEMAAWVLCHKPDKTTKLAEAHIAGATAETTRAGVKHGQVCWRCGEPGPFQDQCHHMEVGTLVRVHTSPPTSPDRAGEYRIPENLPQAQELQNRTYNVLGYVGFHWETGYSFCSPHQAPNCSSSGKDPLRSHGEWEKSTMRSDYLNLLKPWKEVVPVSLAMVVTEKAELGPEVRTKINHSSPRPRKQRWQGYKWSFLTCFRFCLAVLIS